MATTSGQGVGAAAPTGGGAAGGGEVDLSKPTKDEEAKRLEALFLDCGRAARSLLDGSRQHDVRHHHGCSPPPPQREGPDNRRGHGGMVAVIYISIISIGHDGRGQGGGGPREGHPAHRRDAQVHGTGMGELTETYVYIALLCWHHAPCMRAPHTATSL